MNFVPQRFKSRRIPQPGQRGFSLVEVAMALGVFSFAVMGLVGLLPVAVTTHKEAKQDTVLSQIKQRLSAEVLFTDGEKLADLNGFNREFDAEGRELTDHDPSRVVYRGKVQLASFAPPGGPVSASLQRVELYAVHDPTPGGDLIREAPPSASILVPKAANGAASGSSAP